MNSPVKVKLHNKFGRLLDGVVLLHRVAQIRHLRPPASAERRRTVLPVVLVLLGHDEAVGPGANVIKISW